VPGHALGWPTLRHARFEVTHAGFQLGLGRVQLGDHRLLRGNQRRLLADQGHELVAGRGFQIHDRLTLPDLVPAVQTTRAATSSPQL
jgi:hypothetical protein